MVSIEWCAFQKNGLRLIEPNDNVSESYLVMAEESIKALNAVKDSRMWSAVTAYYVFYQSLYSLMSKLGVKCEIHSCSIEFMSLFLDHIYNKKDVSMMQSAFNARTDLQYYADRPVDEKIIIDISRYCKIFYVKTKDSLANISISDIDDIRSRLSDCLKKN